MGKKKVTPRHLSTCEHIRSFCLGGNGRGRKIRRERVNSEVRSKGTVSGELCDRITHQYADPLPPGSLFLLGLGQQFRKLGFPLQKKKKSRIKTVSDVMKIMPSLMVYPVSAVTPGPGRRSAGQAAVRRRSFEGAGPVIAREVGDKDVKFRVSVCVPHTRHTCWRPGHYLFEDFGTESVTL